MTTTQQPEDLFEIQCQVECHLVLITLLGSHFGDGECRCDSLLPIQTMLAKQASEIDTKLKAIADGL